VRGGIVLLLVDGTGTERIVRVKREGQMIEPGELSAFFQSPISAIVDSLRPALSRGLKEVPYELI